MKKLFLSILPIGSLITPITMVSCQDPTTKNRFDQMIELLNQTEVSVKPGSSSKSIDQVTESDFNINIEIKGNYRVVIKLKKTGNKALVFIKIMDISNPQIIKETAFKQFSFEFQKLSGNNNNSVDPVPNPEPKPTPTPQPEPTPTPQPDNNNGNTNSNLEETVSLETKQLNNYAKLMKDNLEIIPGMEKHFYWALNNGYDFHYDYQTQTIVCLPNGEKVNWKGTPNFWRVLRMKQTIFPNTKYMLVNYDEPLFNHNLVLVSKKQIDFEFDNQNNIIFKFKTGLYKGKNKNELASTVGETANLGKMPEIIEEPIDNSVNPEPNPTPDPETGNNNGGSSNTGDSDSSNKPVVTQRDGNIEYNVSDDYYASLQNKSGIALIDSLFAIQKSSSRHVPGYDALFTTYRDAFVDKYYEKDGTVMDIYGENPNGPDPFNFEHGKYKDVGKDEGAGMNREHIVAQSWFGRSAPMRNDAHHVWPSDKKVNAMHGNYPFGTVTKAKYVSLNGTKIGVSEEDGGPVCEPIDIFKGDVARAFFYFAFTYRDKNLRANDSARRFFINTKNEINPKFLKTLLKWHHDDPVDQFDIDRNNGIAKHQVVRNPFTDYPELVDVIFNNKIDYTFINKGVALNFMPKN